MKHKRGESPQQEEHLLESLQLDELEGSFRGWAAAGRSGTDLGRRRILLIFLLIRYSGAKLGEVLGLRPEMDFRAADQAIVFRGEGRAGGSPREVGISAKLAGELTAFLRELRRQEPEADLRPFAVDPAFVRRKFYERARSCGFIGRAGGPEMIRKARAVELVRNDLPLPAVQRLLGHSNPTLTTSFMSFPEESVERAIRRHLERESGRTSARNTFSGKVRSLTSDSIQTLVELRCTDNAPLWAMITNASAERLGLTPGRLVTAEIKAPWLILEPDTRPGDSSAENMREGILTEIRPGELNTECTVRLPDGAELCAITASHSFARLQLKAGDKARVLFGCCAVVLRVE